MSESILSRELKKMPEKDRRQIEQAQEMLGPDPGTMGPIKNLFWGGIREDLLFPYPSVAAEERQRCDELLDRLDDYLRNEHPHFDIDRRQHIPDWCIERLFELGVMGMIIPPEYGGGGFGITSYNRVLQRIGRTCGSTAVLVSAHQSIGCGALKLFGNESQKRKYLPRMATDTLSAFCLSEPNVGCDAGGQETRCRLSEDGRFYILSGEKKWATSGALAGLFTVMAKQMLSDPATGEKKEKVTALICTPDMPGVEIFSRNRSKCGIRGTWQARIRFTDVKVPRENLLHEEGRGLNVALTCLDFGRCTLSAGMMGAAQRAYEQGVKWAQYRHQFARPIAEFEQVRALIASMAAYTYAMEAMLYMTTGMLDRGDEDIMLETAVCKVFCSEMGFRTIDHALEIMGGEGYMTENRLERLWRDSRINIIVEGANEVMHSFIFGYGSKQLGEHLLGIRAAPLTNLPEALQIALELGIGLRRPRQRLTRLHPGLGDYARGLERRIQEFSHQVKRMLKDHRERLMRRQMIQARLSWAVVWIHAMVCSLARYDRTLRSDAPPAQREREARILAHLCATACKEIDEALRSLRDNTDATLDAAADAALAAVSELPNNDYAIPEKTPDGAARGTGAQPDPAQIEQFGAGSTVPAAAVPR